MARGVGALNVSVNANTSQAIKNLKEFRSETKQTAQSARDLADSYRGNTVSDYEQKQRRAADAMREQAREAKEAARAMRDYQQAGNGQVDTAKKQISIIKQLNGAMSQLKAVGKAAAVLYVGIEGFNFGQKIRGHIQEIHSWADAWRELKAAVGQGKGAVEEEMDRLAERDKRSSARDARMDEHLAYAKDLAKREDEFRIGKAAVRRKELEEKYGKTTGGEYARREEELAAREKARELQQEAYKKAVADKRHAEEEAERKRKEAEREKERKHEEAKRKAAENARRDAEAVQKLRDRIADFGKTDLQREHSELLRTIEDANQRREATRHFRTLASLQEGDERVKQLQEDRKNFAGRQDANLLDARTAEGWKALRANLQDPQLKKFDQLIELQKQANELAAARAEEEVFKL